MARSPANQPALGDRHHPIPTTPDTVPAGCWWFTDPDGALSLLPGCMARIQDPEAECTCDTLGARLERTQRKLREERAERQYAEAWYQALHAALDAHPAGPEIRADARSRRDATPARP